MNALLRFGFLLAFAMANLAGAATIPDAQKIEAEVTRLDASRVDALLAHDIKALERIFSDRMVYIHSAGRVDTKQNYLASLAAGNLTYVTLRYEPPAIVHVMSGDTAVVTGRATIEVKNKAGQVTK